MTSPKPTRVLLVDDSGIHRRALSGYLRGFPELDLCGIAHDGQEAVECVARLRPDVVLMDVQMPVLDGLAATREIMSEHPTPILLMTALDNFERDVDLGLRALALGALDLVPKPNLDELTTSSRGLAERLQLLAGVPVIHHPRGGGSSGRRKSSADGTRPRRAHSSGYYRRARRVVGIVSSTGGPRALTQILSALEPGLPASIVIVQHIAAGFEEGLARWLNENSPLTVAMGSEGAPLMTGQVFLAPQGVHTEVTPDRRLKLVDPGEVPPGRHCPSGDHLLASLAGTYGRHAIGVVLTGIGSDGADGLARIREAGGRTLAQDEETSVVYGMPSVAASSGAAERVLPLGRIAPILRELTS